MDKEMNKDSLDLAKQILDLYSQNVEKSSGQISKDSLSIPLYFNTADEMHKVHDVFYVENFGIVLR
jgi:hypothetical protein